MKEEYRKKIEAERAKKLQESIDVIESFAPHSDSEQDEILGWLQTLIQGATYYKDDPGIAQVVDAFADTKQRLTQWSDRRAEKLVVEARIDEDTINKIETIHGYLKPLYDDLDVIKQHTSWHFLPGLIEESEEWINALTATKEEE